MGPITPRKPVITHPLPHLTHSGSRTLASTYHKHNTQHTQRRGTTQETSTINRISAAMTSPVIFHVKCLQRLDN